MADKKHFEAERRLRKMIENLPAESMPDVKIPSRPPDAIRWGRYRGSYQIWYLYRSSGGFSVFPVSSWDTEGGAASAALEAAREHPNADLCYLDRPELKEMLEWAK